MFSDVLTRWTQGSRVQEAGTGTTAVFYLDLVPTADKTPMKDLKENASIQKVPTTRSGMKMDAEGFARIAGKI